ncbi:hypothetical protein DERP_003624 [Dermatophagoides pteronyssinus]|uniref:Uncharacterized protein n=1 Tax=Dermatophagoides pteronyssinus TaxID=6956 RepID=A0ABQ8JLN9_DERPT|nr:hypothetical protein DERP_003624 [Dermatophagoides pteronyssinus]
MVPPIVLNKPPIVHLVLSYGEPPPALLTRKSKRPNAEIVSLINLNAIDCNAFESRPVIVT